MSCHGRSNGGANNMKSYLNWDVGNVPFIFFKWWNASSTTSFYISIIVIFLLSFLYEGILNCRAWFDQFCRITNNNANGNSKTNLVISAPFTIGQQILRACLHAFCAGYSLIMMMIFMTFNGWFCTSMVIGTLFGYLFFNIWIPEPDLGALASSRPRTCCGC